MYTRIFGITMCVGGCISAGDKNQGLGPCGIDESNWGVASYNFTDDGLYFGCQPTNEEVFHVVPTWDNLILNNQEASDALMVAVAVWNTNTPLWNFSSNYDPNTVFDPTDGLSSFTAEEGYSERPDRLASKSATVYNDNNLDCDVRFFAQKADINENVENIAWSRGTGAGYELPVIMTHELGHCLGLGHPDPGTFPTSIMREEIGIGETDFALTAMDIDAIQFLYGTGTTTTPP